MLRDTIVPQASQGLKQSPNGIMLFYDTSRSKWVSIARETFAFGIDHKNISNNRWLRIVGGSTSNTTGYKIPRNGIITSITVQTDSTSTCSFKIKKNGNPTDICSIDLTNENSKTIDDLDIDLDLGDWLQAFVEILSSSVNYPEILLEIAWRES